MYALIISRFIHRELQLSFYANETTTGLVDNAKTAYYSNSAMLARLPFMI